MTSPPPPTSIPSSVAGRYEVVRVLAHGGMGVVYEATHAWTRRRVALKVLRAEFAHDDDAVARFRREARAGVQSAHPNIAEVLDMGVDPQSGTLYIAQELLLGEDLAARLARTKRLSLREAAAVMFPAMEALEAAHRAGVVHRDVKPANIFIARDPRGGEVPKVIDFGVATIADGAAVTRAGTPVGTPQYMAPEQARGERNLDQRVDVWAVGAVWFEVLTGRRPIAGESYHQVLAALLHGAPPRFLDEDPIPPGVRGPIERALSSTRARRFASIGAFARALLAAPDLAATPWGEALTERFSDDALAGDVPVSLTVDPRPMPPITLDLPDALDRDSLVTETTAAPSSSASTTDSSRQLGRRQLRVGVMLAALTYASVAMFQRVRPHRAALPHPAAAVTGVHEHPPTRVAPARPPLATAFDGGRGVAADEQKDPRISARPMPPTRQPRALQTPFRVRAPAPINGAPVLEP